MLSTAEQIILHSYSDKQVLYKVGLLCKGGWHKIEGKRIYYFKDGSYIITEYDTFDCKFKVVGFMDGEE